MLTNEFMYRGEVDLSNIFIMDEKGKPLIISAASKKIVDEARNICQV